ncbi:MAG: hypothetical protein IPI07_02995 [Flavobacteriales bacterium]|nr:hypothetical protein [Flavobacteriales bacterium]
MSTTYFDAEGKSLRKAFLQAPIKFSRISSGFSRKRFHPVQKRFKAHHRREEFPSAEPVAEVHRARFAQERDRLVEALAQASGRADQTVVF